MADTDDERPNVKVLEGNDFYARGLVQPVTGTETHPCMICVHFEKPELQKMIQHMVSHGCTLLPDGRVQSPRPKAESGINPGAGLVIDPHDFGWCARDIIPTELLATCEAWEQKKTRRDFR